jgi:hypothetical protein
VAFNGSASDQNPDVLSFAWDFGDGKSAFGLTAHHAYVTRRDLHRDLDRQ